MRTVVLDIDQTFADNSERWNRYSSGLISKEQFHSMEEVIKDKIIEPMYRLYEDLSAWNNIILLSARHELDREVTEAWLKQHRITYLDLILDSDNELSAADFKHKVVKDLIKKGIDIWLVVDDNYSVTQRLRTIEGLLVLQC